MPTAADEFTPDRALVDRVVRHALLPYLCRWEQTLETPLPASLEIWAQHERLWSQRVASALAAERPERGQIRIRFRRTYRRDRTLFACEALFPGIAADGWCGFLFSGEVLGSGASERVRYRRIWMDGRWIDRNIYKPEWRGWQW